MSKAISSTFKPRLRSASAWAMFLVLTSCTALLPKGENVTESPWHSFDEAKQSFEKITPYQTKIDDLKHLGIDPFSTPNITILTYSDILRRFVPSTIIQPDDLDGGIRDCLAAKELCRGYEIDHKQIKRKRYGNFWLDFLNFDRKTEVTGWRFNAVIVIKDNLVTYKLWSGQPLIHELEDNRNPLGPFQGSGEGAARIR
jgi:hypothetical protein